MTLPREAIVDHLKSMVGPARVITDEQVLKENSHNRYKKVETIFGVYTTPIPAAVVKPADTPSCLGGGEFGKNRLTNHSVKVRILPLQPNSPAINGVFLCFDFLLLPQNSSNDLTNI